MSDLITAITNEQIRTHLTPDRAFYAVRQAFLDLAEGAAADEPRHRMALGQGTFNVMWANSNPLDSIALKAYPVIRSDVRQAAGIHISLYRQSTGSLDALVRGDVLGQIRTGAASAVVAEMVANPKPQVLTVFGTGFQAHGQLVAFLSRFPSINKVFLIGRTPETVDKVIAELRPLFPDCSISAGEPEQAVRSSDLVVTATSSTQPVLNGEWLKAGAHLSAVGSNHADSREVDAQTLARTGLVVVDNRQTAQREAGDLIANGFSITKASEVSDVVLGHTGRDSPDDITLFCSQGLAVQDLYAARSALTAIEANTNGGQGL